jgi:peptidoglycan-N-acetylglucosamine deacetylase
MLLAAAVLVAGATARAASWSRPMAQAPATTLAAAAFPVPELPRSIIKPAPTPPAAARVVLAAATSRKVVALTFDLDMTPDMAAATRTGAVWVNSDAIAYLQSNHIHATLFMTGMWAEIYPSLARRLASNPEFEIGNHSYSHPAFHTPCYRLGGVSRAAQARQIQLAQQAIRRSTGITPTYFRFPGGCYDRQALDLVHAAGLTPVEWSVNSIDAFNSYPQQIAAVVLSQVRPGSIVVMHLQGGANAPATGLALRLIIPALATRGYELLTVSQLLAAGRAIQPTDPREVVEYYQAPPTPAPMPVVARHAIKPAPRWCGWVKSPHGWVYVCR